MRGAVVYLHGKRQQDGLHVVYTRPGADPKVTAGEIGRDLPESWKTWNRDGKRKKRDLEFKRGDPRQIAIRFINGKRRVPGPLARYLVAAGIAHDKPGCSSPESPRATGVKKQGRALAGILCPEIMGEWVMLGQALGIIARKTGRRGAAAQAILLEALPEISTVTPIGMQYLGPEHLSGARINLSTQDLELEDVRKIVTPVVNVRELSEWLDNRAKATAQRAEATKAKNKGGRPGKWNWEAAANAVWEAIFRGELPEEKATVAAVTKRMADWFIDQTDNEPAPSDLKKHAGPIVEAIKRA